MRRLHSPGKRLLCLLIILVAFTPLAPLPQAQSATARFVSQQKIAWPIPFSDQFLSGDGRVYHQGLARSSLGMALSAFRVPGAEPARRGDNIKSYLRELGFSQLSLYQYDVTPSINTIACAFGHKTISLSGTPLQVVAVAVSGGGYQDEWQSNLTLGRGLHHQGFNQAARQVEKQLARYLSDNKITGRVKLWLSGYSRAAAVSNRTAAILLDEKRVQPEDLFAYTFATPNVTQQKNAPDYPSIFNIVGSFDPVMMIPFDDWGFTRYGRTFYLPTPETNSDYEQRVLPVKAKYLQMTGSEYITTASGNRLVHQLLSLFSGGITNTENYAAHYQNYLTSLWTVRSSPWGMLAQTARAFLNDRELFKQMRGISTQAWTLYANTTGENLLKDSGFYQDDRLVNAGPYGTLVHEHYPKKYLAWLAAYDDLNSMASPNRDYRQLAFTGALNLRLVDEKGESLLDHRFFGPPAAAKGQALFAVSQVGDETVVTVPADKTYQVDMWTDGPESTGATFSIKQGRIGFTRMAVYKAPAFTLAPGKPKPVSCTLSADMASPVYALQMPGGSISLTAAPDASLFSQGEANSGIKTLLSKNMVTLLGAALMLLVQGLVFLILTTRAGLRHRRDRAMRLKTHAPHAADPLRSRLKARLPASRGLRWMATLLFLVSMAAMGLSLLLALKWWQEAALTAQLSLRRFSALTSLPYLVLMMLSALPALAAAVQLLFRLEKRPGTGRSCLFFCLFALLYTAGMLGFSIYNTYLAHPWLPALALVQGVVLILAAAFLIRYLRQKRASGC